MKTLYQKYLAKQLPKRRTLTKFLIRSPSSSTGKKYYTHWPLFFYTTLDNKLIKRIAIENITQNFIHKYNHMPKKYKYYIVNYIILEVKYFIYRCKLNKTSLSLRLLLDKFKRTFQTERFVAGKNNKLSLLYNKWKPLLPLIEQ